MSYTNQTQHYGLPQYVATDVPAYLTDYNGAMAKIDQGMNAAKTQADSAATAAGQAANDIAALQSTVGTQAAQISAAAQAAAAAQTTANGADEKADVNAGAIESLDTRVTDLEESAGALIVYEDLIVSNANYKDVESIPIGYQPIAVVVMSSNQAGVTALMSHVDSVPTDYRIYFERTTASSIAPFSFSGTVRVFYAKAVPAA